MKKKIYSIKYYMGHPVLNAFHAMCMCVQCRFQSPKLKTGYRYENQFWNPGFTNGVRQLCGYQYFCNEILFYLGSLYSPFFRIS